MSRSYEYRMVAILCAAFGVLSFEIFNVGYLAPFIARGLALTHAEIGLLLSAFWITYALGSYLAGVATDAWGHRKALLVTCLLLVSCCSVLSGIARSFGGWGVRSPSRLPKRPSAKTAGPRCARPPSG